MIEAGIHVPSAMNRPYVLPPGTAKERVSLLRKAFMETMKDPEFLADANKSKLDVEPLPGDEAERTIAGLLKLNPAVAGKLKELLK